MREPDQVLADLGSELRRGWARAPRRRAPLFARSRNVVLVAAAAFVLVPGAVATRDAIFAGDPPPFPERLRTPGAALPGAAVYVARGSGWSLSASSCASSVSVFLEVPGGGAGSRCDVGAAPAHRTHTYYDPNASRTWVFGVAPGGVRAVQAAGRTAPVRDVGAEALRKGRLPAGLRVFVLAIPGAADVTDVRLVR